MNPFSMLMGLPPEVVLNTPQAQAVIPGMNMQGNEIISEGYRGPRPQPAAPVAPTAPPTMRSVPYDNFELDNVQAIKQRLAANQAGEAVSAAEGGREGMFGTRGTLRDILGLVGDSFLMMNGNDPLYYNRREEERLGDAMTGYSVNPMAAAERAYGEDPAFAQQAMIQAQARQQAIEKAKIDMANAQRLGVESEREALTDGAERFGGFFGSLTPETYGRGKEILQTMREAFGLGDEFEIPDTYDPELARMYQMGGMPTSRQVSAAQGDRRIEQGDERQKETERRNRETERLAQERLAEQRRANRERESDRDYSNETSRNRPTATAGRRGNAPQERERGKIYVNGQGQYEYITSQGSVIRMTEEQAREQYNALRAAGR